MADDSLCCCFHSFVTQIFKMNFTIDLLTDVFFRTATVYLFLVGGLLLFGKREISQLSIIDLVFILLISNSVQNAMVGPSNSLESGLVSATSLFLLNATLKFFSYRFKPFNRIVEGHPVMLIYKGTILKSSLEKEKITIEELHAVVREHGVEAFEQVKLAILETDGNISVITKSDDDVRFYPHPHKSHPKISKNP